MKKIISIALALVMLIGCVAVFAACDGEEDAIIVQTNAYFAPFEYYDGTEIVGVDVEIMNRVGEKLGKEIVWNDGDFGIIIDTVKEGKLADCGAAGLTITDERKDKVDFSDPYYTSVQYVILPANSDIETKTVDGVTYIVWEALSGKTIATQTDTTGWIYTDGEINATADNDYGYDGVLYGTGTKHEAMDSANVAADALGITIDAVIVDELPAKYIVANSTKGFTCYPLYYSGADGEADSPVEEQYAIAVTKGNTELLEAINEVLAELLKKDANGQTEIEKMVMSHMGMND
ncbi:MAG: transporter substrate-binding domain-containing protein [Clostridia bacterium]|nr:transporter substrate-binding domain-containing protein [Clostridia bacterium]